jgi:hypothetical protein
MLSLIFGLLLIVLIVWLVTGITRTRKNPLDDIAKLAAIEATAPQDSAARKLLAEELARPAREAKRRQGLAIFIAIFFFAVYVIGSTSGVPTPNVSAPIEPTHPSAASSDIPPPSHPPVGPVGTATVPQRSLTTVIKSRPACLLADDYVQLANMAIAYDSRPSPKAARSAVDFANNHCQRIEVGQKVWFEDKAERTIDGPRTIKLACVAITLYMIAPETLPSDYKPVRNTCYWTDLSALDDKR